MTQALREHHMHREYLGETTLQEVMAVARVIGLFPSRHEVGRVVSALREAGYHREQMIITNSTGDEEDHPDVAIPAINLKTETDQLGRETRFNSYLPKGFQVDRGIVVAVESSDKDRSNIGDIMKRQGAEKITFD